MSTLWPQEWTNAPGWWSWWLMNWMLVSDPAPLILLMVQWSSLGWAKWAAT